jgi:hypothetical protein
MCLSGQEPMLRISFVDLMASSLGPPEEQRTRIVLSTRKIV